MAKNALVVVFSLALVLSIQSVIGDEASSPEQANDATSELLDDFADSLSSSEEDDADADSVKDTASSLIEAFSPQVNEATSEIGNAALSLSSSAGNAPETEAPSPEQANKFTSAINDAAQSLSSLAGNADESAEEPASSWTDWAKDKLRGYGLMSPKESAAWAPAMAPAPAFARSFGPAPADAPVF